MNNHNVTGIALVCIILASCNPQIEATIPWPFDEDTYFFIEYRVTKEGRLIQGDYPRGWNIDFPSYLFDPDRGSLASQQLAFSVNDTLKIVLGRRTALQGLAGGGVASRLYGVYGFPHEHEDLIINGVDQDGKAHLQFREEQIIIDSHNEWVHTTIRRDTTGSAQNMAIAEFTDTIRIVNFGALEKAAIRTW